MEQIQSIKKLNTEYCFMGDMDMIFHPQFVEKAFLAQDVEYIFKQIKPKLEREFVREKVLKKYMLIGKVIKP